jgi:hypothetical protein
MTISQKIEKIKELTEAAFAHANPNHPSCYGHQITPDDPHPLCLECGFLEACKVEGQNRLAEMGGQAVEEELAALESLAQLEAEFAVYTEPTPEPEPVVEPEIAPVVEVVEPVIELEPEPVVETVEPVDEAEPEAEPVAEEEAEAVKGNALAGFDWPALIRNLVDVKPATYKEAAKMMRAEFKAFGFAPKYSSHSGHYINKVLKGLVGKGTLTVNADKTITWA